MCVSASALCVLYDYFPAALTLEQRHLLPSVDASTPPSTYPAPLVEAVLWSYICQLVSAIQAVHAAGLALYDALSVRRILVVSPNRIRVNAVGVRDLLHNQSDIQHSSKSVRHYQLEDLYHLGQLILTLAAIISPSDSYPPYLSDNIEPALELSLPSNLRPQFRLAASRYSPDLAHLIAYVMTATRFLADVHHTSAPTAAAIASMIAHRIIQQHSHSLQSVKGTWRGCGRCCCLSLPVVHLLSQHVYVLRGNACVSQARGRC
jgi:hypothetical protein